MPIIRFHLTVLVSLAFAVVGLNAAVLQGGRFTQISRDVRIAEPAGSPKRVVVNAEVRSGVVRSGVESRAEITFADQSVVRLGDKTEVSIDSQSRGIELKSGAVLTQVPAGVGSTTLKVRDIVATATGTTLIVEYSPDQYAKFISAEGTSRLCLKRSGWSSDCVLLRAGQMIIVGPGAKMLPEAVDVDLGRFIETCHFITQFHPLPDQQRVVKAVAAQGGQKSHGAFADTNLVILGRGTLVSKRDAAGAPSPSKQPPGKVSPTPAPPHP